MKNNPFLLVMFGYSIASCLHGAIIRCRFWALWRFMSPVDRPSNGVVFWLVVQHVRFACSSCITLPFGSDHTDWTKRKGAAV